MSVFEWRDEFSVNVALMDEQHKKLISLIELMDLETKSGKDTGIVAEIMDEVIEYVKTHFAAEEKLMADNKYQDLDNHRKIHIELSLKAVEFRKNYKENTPSTNFRFSQFLIEWLMGHIMGVDKKYGKFPNEKGLY
ncbi:MAG TPA: bacteriohemerythrin [bacterium]|nr:bacteriohemerythrin [bacterium]HPI78177.1 bacteriohemerythrin [bacterium]